MIEKLTIDYNGSNPPKGYWWLTHDGDGNPRRLLPNEVKFDNGLNVIIGNNGCGKTTLLKLISDFCFVRGLNQHEFWEIVEKIYPQTNWLNKDYSVVQDFVKISNNFDCPVFRMDNLSTKLSQNYNQFANFNEFQQFWSESKLSKGQKVMSGLMWNVFNINKQMKNYSWEKMFPEDYEKNVNDVWSEAYKKIHEYIETHNNTSLEKRVTVLLDEPDEGLDIDNLNALRSFLLNAKENTQVIVVLHNQLLIKSLVDEANIIELSDGYLKKIKEF